MSAARDDPSMIARQLASTELDDRRAALDELAAHPVSLDAPLALAVAGCLAGPRKDVQRRAVDVLRRGRGADHDIVLEALRVACTASDPVHRWGAVYALGHLGRFESAMIPPLLEALGHPDGDQQQKMAQANRATMALRAKQVEAAFQRLAEGTYGTCAACEENVGYRRLKARPEAPFCINCQTRRERR